MTDLPTAPNGASQRPGTFLWSLSLAQLVSWGILFYSFAVLVVPMEDELGWSKTALNTGITLGLIVSGMFAPLVGAQIDRGHAWPVMSLGSLVGSLAMAAWSFVDAPWAFWMIWVGLGVAMSCTLYEPGFAVLARTLGDDAPRGILKMTLVGGFASTAFIPLAHLLVQLLGWRHAVLTLAIINLVIAGGIHAVMLSPSRMPPPSIQESGASTIANVSTRAALADPRFWTLLVSFAAYMVAFTAMTFHFLPLLDERGISRNVGVALFTVIGPLQVAGRLLLFAGGNLIAARLVGRVALIVSVPLFTLAALAGTNLVLLTVFVAIYGIINGILTVVRGTIVRDLFGARNYGTISGSLTLPTTFARAAGPACGALLWTIGRAYEPMLLALAGICLIGAAAYWSATRPAPPS